MATEAGARWVGVPVFEQPFELAILIGAGSQSRAGPHHPASFLEAQEVGLEG